jgi:hypothetical protein
MEEKIVSIEKYIVKLRDEFDALNVEFVKKYIKKRQDELNTLKRS